MMEKFITKKKFGQNFLNNTKVISDIVNSIDVKENDLVIEIGPGKGALTKELVKKNCYLRCFEIDLDTKSYLESLENDKVKIIYEDILKVDVKDIIKDISYENLYIIANLPYYITTPIIQYIIDLELNPKEMTLMVQKEVADRFTANPGTKEYGQLTLKLNYLFDTKTLFIVNRKNFNPIPNVDSAVVKFMIHDRYDMKDYSKFKKLVENSFKMKRKTLKNNLGTDTFNRILPTLVENGYYENVRAEEIDIDTFIKLLIHF